MSFFYMQKLHDSNDYVCKIYQKNEILTVFTGSGLCLFSRHAITPLMHRIRIVFDHELESLLHFNNMVLGTDLRCSVSS